MYTVKDNTVVKLNFEIKTSARRHLKSLKSLKLSDLKLFSKNFSFFLKV
jgi:hypothetical protein